MNKCITDLLSMRKIITVLALFLLIGLSLFLLVRQSVIAFTDEDIRKNMNWVGNSITYFCSSGYDQLAKAGAVDDQVAVRLKKVAVLETIEDFVRNNDFQVVVHEAALGKSRTLLNTLPHGLAAGPAVEELPSSRVAAIRLEGQEFNVFAVPFESWGWRVLLLRQTGGYKVLTERLYGFYVAFGALGVALAVVLLLFLRQNCKAARLLQESGEELKSTLDSLAEGVITLDSEQRITQLNPAAEVIAGCGHNGPCLGRRISDLFTLHHSEDGEPLDLAELAVGNIDTTGIREGRDFFLRMSDGAGKLVQIGLARLPEQQARAQGASLVLSLTDVTERRKMEEQLHQAHKMEIIGSVAGGVAHDLNNILSGIVSYPDLLLLKLPQDSELRQPVEAIQQAGKRAAAVVADMTTVSKGVTGEREVVNVGNLVKEYAGSADCGRLKHDFPEMNVDFPDGPADLHISCSAVHVRKCIHNLMLNGVEATGGTGACAVSSRRSVLNEQQAQRLGVNPGDYVVISVADNGPPMSEKDIDHIFEPFYTTKQMGRSGTGLGMVVVWNCMQEHNGAVDVRRKEEGMVFDLYFPIADHGTGTVGGDSTPSMTELRGAEERILVVDDDELQRKIVTDFLRELNYKVELAASGEEALAKIKESNYDLLLLDMLMGEGMNGRQTYEQVLKVRPRQKALLVSGYSEKDEVQEARRLGIGVLLPKPYSLEQLGRAVYGELHG